MPKPKKGSRTGYKEANAMMAEMNGDQLLDAMQAEIDRGDKCRPDLLRRLAGRYNRWSGDRFTKAVLGLMTYQTPGRRKVRALLDSNR